MNIDERLNELEATTEKLSRDIKILNAFVETQLMNKYYPSTHDNIIKYGELIPCAYENVKPGTPMGLVCCCPKCTVTSLGGTI